MVPEGGFEPPRPCGQRILNPSRLPFRHSGVERRECSKEVAEMDSPVFVPGACPSGRGSEALDGVLHPGLELAGALGHVVAAQVVDQGDLHQVLFEVAAGGGGGVGEA